MIVGPWTPGLVNSNMELPSVTSHFSLSDIFLYILSLLYLLTINNFECAFSMVYVVTSEDEFVTLVVLWLAALIAAEVSHPHRGNKTRVKNIPFYILDNTPSGQKHKSF